MTRAATDAVTIPVEVGAADRRTLATALRRMRERGWMRGTPEREQAELFLRNALRVGAVRIARDFLSGEGGHYPLSVDGPGDETTGKAVSLTATTRPSGSTDLQVGSVELKLGQNARVVVEVRAPTKPAAVARASDLADKFTAAARGDSAASSVIKALVPSQVTAGLKLAKGLARAAGAGRLRSLWRRLPRGVRSRAGRLAKELTS